MSMLTVDLQTGLLVRTNAVAKLAAALIVSVTLMMSIDWVSAAVALLLTACLLPLTGLGARGLWVRLWPFGIVAALAGVTTLLYGRPSGEVYWSFWLIAISDGSIELAVAVVLRVLAIVIPSVVLFMTTDPTDLADGLAQILRLPARFVLGGLAGMRLVGLFMEDWRSLESARRARGVADAGRLRRFAGQAFALLVLSIRRGSKLATAMEARGFGARGTRTWARESVFAARDWALIAVAAAIAVTAVSAAVWAGTWNFILGLD
ncbi:energy-coupling factor transporter transmembrane component T family protein [Microbacterium sp. NIBRBAC000506063]|uniref:energy-coupling factor transporter transmembrane component T family protein n=1 Tax=Microbacterium sp. NIBRBAC000506063 TaxID=2734618 RepID=UPI001BB748E0|nr:energy-coupling factor transporter transmembrane component T [Microbacterium sp. NIBRBAC000506063]QTV79030.1 energy-coupling factor transporter transmembrane protein EcfT [Microbacterium sp. NIBRBAC000506063]